MNLFHFPKASRLALIACSAVVLGANVLSAQVSRGHFTLPVETHWGKAVMAPGYYSYTLDRATVGLILSVRSEGTSVRIPATGAISIGQAFEGSKLLLTSHGRETSVRSMEFGHLGMIVHYQPPKVGDSSFPSSKMKESHKSL
jgi:hypothetical protein